MSWAVTAELSRFDEAVDWFRARVPMTEDEFADLTAEARHKAFTVADLTNLEAVRTVHEEIAGALEHGRGLDDFKRRVKEKLGKLSPDGYHLETVLRNNTQTAYNTGRYYQLTDPSVVALRPYWEYDSVLDTRTTQICIDRDGVILPQSDPFWITNYPPLHHRCRASIRALRTSEVERRGGQTTDIPGTVADEGFGKAPPYRSDPPAPDVSRYEPGVWEAYQKHVANTNADLEEARLKDLAAREARKAHDPATWFDREYRQLYGENAGRAVAWGRAMEERGRALPIDDVINEWKGITETLAHPDAFFFEGDGAARIIKGRAEDALGRVPVTFGEALDAIAKDDDPVMQNLHLKGKTIGAIIAHRRAVTLGGEIALPLPDSFGNVDRFLAARKAQRKAGAFFEALSDASLVHPSKDRFTWQASDELRASCKRPTEVNGTLLPGRIEMGAFPKVSYQVHEWGHAIEQLNPKHALAAREFLQARTANEPAVKLNELLPEHGYRDDEITRRDDFIDAYMGKLYPEDTEITSMALEHFWRDAGLLYRKDAHAFYFALGQLAGTNAVR